MKSFGTVHSEPHARSLPHTDARSLFSPSSRRHFSTSPMQQYKSKFVEAFRSFRERPMIPISRRLRDVPETIIVRFPEAADFLMALPDYKHWWGFNYRLAGICQAECDARPGTKRKKSPVQQARQLWERRKQDCKERMDGLREANIELLELHVKVSHHLVEYWTWYTKHVLEFTQKGGDEGREMRKNWSALTFLPSDPRWKWLTSAVKEQAHVVPLPFRAPEVVEVLGELVNKSMVKCKRWEDVVFSSVIKYRKNRRRLKAAARSDYDILNPAKATNRKQRAAGKGGTKEYKTPVQPSFNKEELDGVPQFVTSIAAERSEQRLGPGFEVQALKRQKLAERKERLDEQPRAAVRRKTSDLSSKKFASTAEELECFAGSVSGPAITKEAARATQTPAQDSPRSGKLVISYSNRPIPASVSSYRNSGNKRRPLSTSATSPAADPSTGEDAKNHLARVSNNNHHATKKPPTLTEASLDASLSEADDPQNPYHLTLAPRAREEFSRKRGLRFLQLRLVARSLRRLARAELAYLDAAVTLSELVCVRLTQRCVALDRRLWPLQPGLPDTPAGRDADARRNEWLRPRVDPETGERGGEDSHHERLGEGVSWLGVRRAVGLRVTGAVDVVAREDNRGALAGAGPVADELRWLESEIRRMRWRVKRLETKAELGEEEWYSRRIEHLVKGERHVDRGMEAFRAYREHLLWQVRERLETEEKTWTKRALKKKVAEMRAAEMWYLEKMTAASGRTLGRLEAEITVLVNEIEARNRKELKNKKGGFQVSEKVRLVALKTTMEDVMEKRAAEAWELARDLEELLR